jgi:hypothetical protein
MLPRLALITLVFTFVVPAYAADECVCVGSEIAHYYGGDKKPLDWDFQSRLAKAGSPGVSPTLVCYLKRVNNNSSTMEVRRVYWEIADFYRRFLPPNRSTISCTTLAGEVKPDPTNGPLWYDVADHLDTTVREPKEGWKQSENEGRALYLFAQSSAGSTPPRLFMPPVASSFVVQLDGASQLETADIEIYSTATSSRFTPPANSPLILPFPPPEAPLAPLNSGPVQLTELYYQFTNNGDTALLLQVNLPNDGFLSREVPIISYPILLKPKQKIDFVAKTFKEVALQRASLIFYNQAKDIVGIDSAGLYGLVEGKRAVEIDSVWQFLRNQR